MALRQFLKISVSLIFIFQFVACGYSQQEKAEELEMKEEGDIHDDLNLTDREEEQLEAKLDTLYKKKLNSFADISLFEDTIKNLYSAVKAEEYNLDFKVFRYAMIGYYSLLQEDKLKKKNLISIIDYTKTSCEKRFYTIDLFNKQFIFNTYVAHGRNTGANVSNKFSNKSQSYQSSIGFYLTGEAYTGSKGYSMRLDGDEVGYNSNIRNRAIVMHNADYVSKDFIKNYGRLGRSLGCPVLPKGISKQVINTIKDRSVIFAYYNDDKYLRASKYLNLEKLIERMGLDVED